MSRITTINPEQATGKAAELLDGVQAKLGMTPNLMRVMANSPAVLEAYLQFSDTLSKGELSAQSREQIALTVSQENSCDYCLSAHSAIGKSVGLTSEQICDARLGDAIDGKADALLKFTKQLLAKQGVVSDDDIATAREAAITDAEITEVVANTALLFFTNYLNHVAETEVDFPLVEKMEFTKSETCCSTDEAVCTD